MPRVRREIPGPVRVREENGREEGRVQTEFGPAALVPGRAGARVAGRELGWGLRVRPVRAGQTRRVPPVRPGLAGSEPGEERGGSADRDPFRGLGCEVDSVSALHGGFRVAAVSGVRVDPWEVGHARHAGCVGS